MRRGVLPLHHHRLLAMSLSGDEEGWEVQGTGAGSAEFLSLVCFFLT